MDKIEVEQTIIHLTQHNEKDYISPTDMLKYKESGGLIFKWLSNKNTIEFLGVWEEIYNPNFNYTEFGVIMSEAGVNRFTMSDICNGKIHKIHDEKLYNICGLFVK